MKAEEIKQLSRGYVEVDLDAIHRNVDSMYRNLLSEKQLVLVIKTDGYGHGAVQIAKEFEEDDRIWGYAVATAEEAKDLRINNISKPVLILGFTFEYAYEYLVSNGIRPAVFKEDMIERLDEIASSLGIKAPVHIKVDTGMTRIGITPDEKGLEFVRKLYSMPNLVVEGIFTHMAKADEIDKTSAYLQKKRFNDFINLIESELQVSIPYKHCNNSAGIVELRDETMDLARAGITLYGLWPSNEVSKDIINLTPVLSWRTHIAYIKEVPAGVGISYGGTYVTDSVRKIATIPVGYGDGYPRGLSSKGYVLINGQKAPICGRVCMDQFMVDITEINDVEDGNLVTLIGNDGKNEITMEELGDLSGRFNYELSCDIGKRMPRVYTKNKEVMDIILDRENIK